MKTFAILILLVSLKQQTCYAQNLVPNPSFEQYNNCPYWAPIPSGGYPNHIVYSPSYDNFPTVLSWVTPLMYNTPAYFNKCDTNSWGHGVPNSNWGYQPAHTGNAYTGVQAFSHTNIHTSYKTFIESKLNFPLLPAHNYNIEFYVSPGVLQGWHQYGGVYATDRIGAYLSDTMVLNDLGYTNIHLYKPASIASPPGVFITDTSVWTKIEGTYTAHGGEQWITIGRFSDSIPERDTFLFNPDSVINIHDTEMYCFMFIDDVCVTDIGFNSIDTTICTGTFPVSLDRATAAGNYVWNTGATSAAIAAEQPGIYWRLTTGDCIYHVDTFRVFPIPYVSLGPDKTVCKEPAYYINTGNQHFIHYEWNTGDTSCCVIADTTGTYYLTANNVCGTSSDTIQLTVIEPCENCLVIPDAFSPNGDGHNDVFKGLVRCQVSQYNMKVYNRWGNLLFSTADAYTGWDGTYNGIPQDMGTYFYYITYTPAVPQAGSTNASGSFILVR